MTAIRRRIPAASGGAWTLHHPVDPGITLLELFAWQLEQRLYWMDQIPDSLVRGALALLGEAPKPTQVAATVMYFIDVDKTRYISKMTELGLHKANSSIVFSTVNDVVLLPFAKTPTQQDRISFFINNKERTVDLDQGKILRLFPSDGSTGEIKIILWLRELLPEDYVNKHFTLFFKLRVPPKIHPQWSPEAAVDVSPPANLFWEYSMGSDNSRSRFTNKEIDDGTGGLRRSGLIAFPIKKDWQPEQGNSTQGYQYALWLRVEETTYTAPPRLEKLLPNVIIARHQREIQKHLLPKNWLPLPGNTISLIELPVDRSDKDYPPIENTVKLNIKERDNLHHQWHSTPDLSFHGSADRVFIVDRQKGELCFGDGLNGRLPVLANDGSKQIAIRYCVGGGSSGKVGENLEWDEIPKVIDTNINLLKSINVVYSEGGAEAETMTEARERVAAMLKQCTRAVTSEDYEKIALTTPGVAISRAHAAVGYHPNHPCFPVPGAVTVFIVPDAPREASNEVDETVVESIFIAAPKPDPGLLTAVRNRLNAMRLIASEVLVSSPCYRPVAIKIEIAAVISDREELSKKIKQSLYQFLDPLIGGDFGQGWPFGEPLRPSAILAQAQQAIGNQGSVTDVRINLLDSQPATNKLENCDPCSSDNSVPCIETPVNRQQENGENCRDVLIGAHDLVELRQLDVKFSPPRDIPGGLQ